MLWYPQKKTKPLIFENKKSELQRESVLEWTSEHSFITSKLKQCQLKEENWTYFTSNQPMTSSLLRLVASESFIECSNVRGRLCLFILFNSKPRLPQTETSLPKIRDSSKHILYHIQNAQKRETHWKNTKKVLGRRWHFHAFLASHGHFKISIDI